MFMDKTTMLTALPNFMYELNTIPIKIPPSYFMNIHKLILIFIGRGKRHTTVNNIEIKKKNGGLMLPNIKTFCKATIIKTV